MDLGAPSCAKRALCELKMALYIKKLQKSGGGGMCPPVPTAPTSMIGTEFSRIHKDPKCLCYATETRQQPFRQGRMRSCLLL